MTGIFINIGSLQRYGGRFGSLSRSIVPPSTSYQVELLLVGGGGQGGIGEYGAGGGGGGGAVIYLPSLTVTSGASFALSIGAGGNKAGQTSGSPTYGDNGGDTTFGTYTALGGGAGGAGGDYSNRGRTGGCGGGSTGTFGDSYTVAGGLSNATTPAIGYSGGVFRKGVGTGARNGSGGGGAGGDAISRTTYVGTTASLLIGGFSLVNINIPSLAFVMGGAYIGTPNDGTVMSLDTSVAGQATFWVATFNGSFTKAVQVQFADSNTGVTVVALQAKYTSGDVRGTSFNFNTSGTTIQLVTSATANGYGIASISGIARGGGTADTTNANYLLWYAGKGGDGYLSSITGTVARYAAGGGGGTRGNDSSQNLSPLGGALGGLGGGGNGAKNGRGGNATGFGCGGGGNGSVLKPTPGGAGSSGVIIVAYPDTLPALTVSGATVAELTSRSGYRVYQITAGSGQITFG